MTARIEILRLSSKGHQHHVETLLSRSAGKLRPGQRVQIGDRDVEFVVLRVDHDRGVADLLWRGSVNKVETGIPVALLRPVQGVKRRGTAGDVEKLG